MKNVRTVIWDCDGVMWFYKEPKVEVQLVADALNIPYSKELEDEYFDMLDSFITYFSSKKVTLKRYYQLIEQKMPILAFSNISIEEFVKKWKGIQSELSIFNQDTQTALEYLKSKGINSVVKTDWWRDIQIAKMKQYGVLDYIKEIHACDNAYLKSHPLATTKEIIKPGEEDSFIIVGDSLKSDIAFAERTGVDSIWFNQDGKKINETPYKPTFEVGSLLEIMNII